MEIIPLLKKIGLNEKETFVYMALLEKGPSSIRQLAQQSGVNRGTVYDMIKSLRHMGLVSYYHKDTKQFFVAEDPEKIVDLLEEKQQSLNQVAHEIQEVIPELKSLFKQSNKKPVVKYYEGNRGIKTILQDILSVTVQSPHKTYHIFSSSTIRPYIHQAWPKFTAERTKQGIRVKVIAVGHTGTKAELSERKSLTTKEGSPTYILIYPGKVAMISINEEKKLLGLIVEDSAIFETQLQLFNFIWNALQT